MADSSTSDTNGRRNGHHAEFEHHPNEIGLTLCNICTTSVNTELKMLRCLHTFCMPCAEKHADQKRNRITCPICKLEYQLPEETGVSGLPSNFFVARLNERKAFMDKLSADCEPECTFCEELDNIAVARCFDCRDYLCEQCVAIHKVVKRLKGHKVCEFDEIKSGNVDVHKISEKEYCKRHEGQVLWFFCETCKTLICRDCAVVDHPVTSHYLVNVEDVSEIQAQTIADLVVKCEKIIASVEEATKQAKNTRIMMDAALQKVHTDAHMIMTRIKEKFLAKLEERQNEISHKVAKLRYDHESQIKVKEDSLQMQVLQLKRALNMTSLVMETGSRYDKAEMYGLLTKTLERLSDVEPASVPCDLGEIRFVPNIDHDGFVVPSFGTIVIGQDDDEHAQEDCSGFGVDIYNGESGVSSFETTGQRDSEEDHEAIGVLLLEKTATVQEDGKNDGSDNIDNDDLFVAIDQKGGKEKHCDDNIVDHEIGVSSFKPAALDQRECRPDADNDECDVLTVDEDQELDNDDADDVGDDNNNVIDNDKSNVTLVANGRESHREENDDNKDDGNICKDNVDSSFAYGNNGQDKEYVCGDDDVNHIALVDNGQKISKDEDGGGANGDDIVIGEQVVPLVSSGLKFGKDDCDDLIGDTGIEAPSVVNGQDFDKGEDGGEDNDDIFDDTEFEGQSVVNGHDFDNVEDGGDDNNDIIDDTEFETAAADGQEVDKVADDGDGNDDIIDNTEFEAPSVVNGQIFVKGEYGDDNNDDIIDDTEFEAPSAANGREFDTDNDDDEVSDAEEPVDEQWEVEREFGEIAGLKDSIGIALYPNGDLAIADYSTAHVKVFNQKGHIKQNIDIKRKSLTARVASKPRSVAISPEGVLFVTDLSPYVKAFDRDSKLINQFQTLPPANCISKSSLSGLAKDERGQIVVGDINNYYISVHKQLDGVHVGSFDIAIKPLFLAAASLGDVIIVSDVSSDPVMVNYSGHTLCTIKHPPNPLGITWRPTGACFKENDDFIIANQSHSGRPGGIYHYSSEGVYIGCITEDVVEPTNVVLTEDGRLVVLEWTLVKIFKKC